VNLACKWHNWMCDECHSEWSGRKPEEAALVLSVIFMIAGKGP